MSERKIELKGRIFITFDIVAITGLSIGGSDTGIEIGGVDKTVIRDKLTNRPYIPGSSLKGKMRSLLEKYHNKPINFPKNKPAFHVCQSAEPYKTCDVCQVFGVSGEYEFATPTRLVVRDTFLSEESAKELDAAQTDLPYTEVKTEVSIDRVTSAANPRQIERVPAGAIFSKGEMVFSLYDIQSENGETHKATTDLKRLDVVREAMRLVEEDYIGGLGSRGSGKVRFRNIKLVFRGKGQEVELGNYPNGLGELTQQALAQASAKVQL